MEKDFRCRGCGFCCQLDVVLSNRDVSRLKNAGYDGFTRVDKGELILNKKGTHCMFYESGMCSVYEYRPDICRRFPFKKDGSINRQCRQMRDFSSQVTQKIIKFMIEDIKD